MNHRPKVRYEVDPHNRLVITETRKKTPLYKFRHVIDGRFKIGKASTLLYHIKTPSDDISKKISLPHQLKFKGIWSLTRDHNLKLTLNKWRRQTFGDELTLKGEIIKVGAHSLLFAITQRTKENVASTRILKLQGSWQADKNNRLTFRAKRERGRFDLLVFDGIWEINRRHKIVYHCEKRFRKQRKHSLLFSGFWSLRRSKVLTYLLDLKGKSAFDFRIGKGIAQGSSMKFEVGIGLSQREKLVRKDIVFYGRWKIKKGAGLIFEIINPGGRSSAIKFEAEAKLIGASRIKLALKSKRGKDLGLRFTLSKKMLKGAGESFIRFLHTKKEKAVYIGSGFRW